MGKLRKTKAEAISKTYFKEEMFASNLISRFSSRSAATATVRAVKRRSLIPTRAALTLTPTAVKRVQDLVHSQPNCIGLKIVLDNEGAMVLVTHLIMSQKNPNLTKS